MAEDHEANRADKSTWVWTPNISYGPFAFGSDRHNTLYVGEEISRQDMGSGDTSIDYRITIDDYTELGFWNDKLMSVDSNASFVHKGTECLFADFTKIKHLFDSEFTTTDEVALFVANYDELNLMVFTEPDWTIKSITVGVDPEIYFPYPTN